MSKRFRFVNRLLMILLFQGMLCSGVWAEVTLIRGNPASGENQVDAQWSKPRPQPEQTVADTEFSARIIMGGQSGDSSGGEPLFDLYTDSILSLAQPLGNTATLNIGATALRRRYLDGREQSYSGALDLQAERWSWDLSGSFADSLRTLSEEGGVSTADVDKGDLDLVLATTFNAAFLQTLPMSLSFQYGWIQESEDGTILEDSQNEDLDFMARGTIGTVGLELGASVGHGIDRMTDIETLNSSANLSVNLPVLPRLHLRPGVNSAFSKTEQVSGDATFSTALDTSLGLYFPLNDYLELRLVPGITNTWASGLSQAAATWSAETGVEWQPESGYFTSATYALGATYEDGGNQPNQSHQGDLSLGWRNPGSRGTLRGVEAGTDLSVQLDESGRVDNGQGQWSAVLNLQPSKTMTVDSSYVGSISNAETPAEWTHTVQSELVNVPDPLLNYQLSASLSDTSSQDEHTLTADGLARITLLPSWNLKTYTLSVGENVVYSRELSGATEQDVIAKTFTAIAVPVLSFLKLRYDFTWEWVSRIDEGGPAGSAFLHLAGITLSGQMLPFDLTANYQIGHGFRGLRHDVNANLDVPFRGGFGVKAEASFSRYREEGTTVAPYLVGLHGVYEY